MRMLFTILILLFSSSVFAEDISDFEIEGISLGDSALDFFSEEKINSNELNYYNNKKFTPVEIYDQQFYGVYDLVLFDYKTGDRNYIIYSIRGIIDYPDNINDCYKLMDKIAQEISNIFTEAIKKGPITRIHKIDPTGKSNATFYTFSFKSGDGAAVFCYDYSVESNYMDHLNVGIFTRELDDFLREDAYN